jgi:hypothetical protein
MLTKDAIAHFDGAANVARALDVSPAAISKWGSIVPLESALAIEIITHRKLLVDRSKYPRIAHALNVAESSRGAA